jgi:hypothetical protein
MKKIFNQQFSLFLLDTVDTGGKFATGINNTSETGGKNPKRSQWNTLGLGGN